MGDVATRAKTMTRSAFYRNGGPRRVYLSTGQVAELMGVAPRTVSKWMAAGLLKGFRLPDSPDRRFQPLTVAAFCRAHGYPVPPELLGLCRAGGVLVVSDAPDLDGLAAVLEAAGLPAVIARSAFDAGAVCGTVWPRVVVIDSALGRAAALAIADGLRLCPWAGDAKWVYLAGEDEAAAAVLSGFDLMLLRPLPVAAVAEAVAHVAG